MVSRRFVFPMTYAGLLDDVLAKYSNEFQGPGFFNRMIAKNVLFGGGIYMNDGYLVLHKAARGYLESEDSLLSTMLQRNFVRVLSRFDDPGKMAEMPKAMAKKGILSFQKLEASADWPRFKKRWYRISDAVFAANSVRPWPNRRMEVGLTKLLNRALSYEPSRLGLTGLDPDVWARIGGNFRRRHPVKGRARDKFERAAMAILDQYIASDSQRKRLLKSIMNIAIQAYHYNFGLGLTSEDWCGVSVDTTIGMAFDELLALDSEVDMRVLKKIRLFGVPKKIAFDNGEAFIPFVSSDSSLFQAKQSYAQQLTQAIGTRKSADEVASAVRAASDLYAKEIVKALGKGLKTRDFHGDANDKQLHVAPGVDAESPVAIGASQGYLAIALQKAAGEKGLSFLVKRGIISKKSSGGLSLGDVLPQLTSLAFDKGKADDFMRDIPLQKP